MVGGQDVKLTPEDLKAIDWLVANDIGLAPSKVAQLVAEIRRLNAEVADLSVQLTRMHNDNLRRPR